MPDKVRVLLTPNTGPALKEVWAFVSRDKDGRENVIGGHIGNLGWQPLITGNPTTFQIYKRLVAESITDIEGGGQTVHLLHFTNREEIEKW